MFTFLPIMKYLYPDGSGLFHHDSAPTHRAWKLSETFAVNHIFHSNKSSNLIQHMGFWTNVFDSTLQQKHRKA